jgi:hypothetical protein
VNKAIQSAYLFKIFGDNPCECVEER